MRRGFMLMSMGKALLESTKQMLMLLPTRSITTVIMDWRLHHSTEDCLHPPTEDTMVTNPNDS